MTLDERRRDEERRWRNVMEPWRRQRGERTVRRRMARDALAIFIHTYAHSPPAWSVVAPTITTPW